jgi:uncharacterized membrane protein (DUF106 family)
MIDWLSTIWHALAWWQWLVNGVGLGLAIALIVLVFFGAPALAKGVGKTLASWLEEFLSTRIGMALAIGLLGFFAGSVLTAHNAVNDCNARIEKLQQDAEAERQRQAEEARRQQQAADRETLTQLDAQNRQAEGIIRDLQQQLADMRPGPTALFDPQCRATAAGVRAFAGQGAPASQ